jgi:CubicO group peptidase (beta-lactamase class C family)
MQPMIRSTIRGVCALSVLAWATTALAFEPLPRAAAEDQHVDPTALAAAFDDMEQLGYVRAMVVARNGQVLGEEHWLGAPETLRQSRSVTKSVTSMLICIAIERGLIPEGAGARLVDYLPDDLVPDDPAKHEILLWHLLTMSSGFEWDEDADVVPWLFGPDPVRDILSRPLAAAPGTQWNYNTAASHLLSVVLSEASGMNALQFADAHLFGPLGITDRRWLLTGGYPNGGHGLLVRTEDLAKLGVLYVNGGRWGDEQVVPSWWVDVSTSAWVHNIGSMGPLTNLGYGWLWWLGRGADYDVYTALGWGGQFVFCVPDLRLVVAVHTRHEVDGDVSGQQVTAILDVIVDRLLPAVADRRRFVATGLEVPELAAVDLMMQDMMVQNDIRGSTVAIAKDGRLVYARGFTWDDLASQPIQPTTLFRIGSIGKSITSIAVHRLIERGLLSYDTPVASTLDLRPPPGQTPDPLLDQVTLDHLLTHTVGWDSDMPGGIDPMVYRDEVVASALGVAAPPTRHEIATFMTGQPFQFTPGERWSYCNVGYLLLQMLAERTTGQDFPEYVLNNLFRPIGVGRARLAHTLRHDLAPTEAIYTGVEGDPYRLTAENGFAAGGMVMAAPDLARLYSALFDSDDGGGVLEPDTIESMLELPFPASVDLGYGRGWFTEDFFVNSGHTVGWLTDPDDGLEVHSHGGGGGGVHTLALWRSDGITFAWMTNRGPTVPTVDFPEITSWPDHDLWESVGITTGPAGSAAAESWVPIVAHSDGVGDSTWRSDVGLLNRSPLANRVRLRYHGANGFVDHELELSPGAYRAVRDVVAAVGSQGSGPLQVFASEALTVTSRTFNQAPSGTFGQALDAVTATGGLQSGESAVLMQLREDDAARSNIGILNQWRREAEVEIALFDGSSLPVAFFTETVPALSTVQINRPFRDIGGRTDIRSGYAVVSVLSGQDVYAYGSVVDNATDDPTTIPMKRDPGATVQLVAAAAATDGAHGSRWRTDLCLLNRSGAQASAEIRYRGDDGGTSNLMITLATGQQRTIEDVVSEIEMTGGGWVEVVSDQPVHATSRTYNVSDEGTYGQLLDGVPADATARAGQVVWLPQLQQNATFRTNIGFVNGSHVEASVRIRLLDADGHELAVRRHVLAPVGRLQLQEPFSRIAGRNDLDTCYATVEVLSGEGVIAYASVIDNATNDPTTVAMRF